jgi:hypothetical protein
MRNGSDMPGAAAMGFRQAMAQKVSVPAIVTAILAVVAAFGSLLGSSFTAGRRWSTVEVTMGSIEERQKLTLAMIDTRLGNIQRSVDAQDGRLSDLQTRVLMLDQRIQQLERKDRR